MVQTKSIARLHLYRIEYTDDTTGELYFGDRLLGTLKNGKVVGVYNEGCYVDMMRRDLGKVLRLMSIKFPDIKFPNLCVSGGTAVLSMFRILLSLDKMARLVDSVYKEGSHYYIVAEGLLWNKPSLRYGVVDTDDYWLAEKEMRMVLLDSEENRWFACAVFDEPFDFNISLNDIVHLYDN